MVVCNDSQPVAKANVTRPISENESVAEELDDEQPGIDEKTGVGTMKRA